MSGGDRPAAPDSAPAAYLRATDPLPLESPDDNRLHEFYEYLAAGRLTTTRCRGCGRIDWPPRVFCPACVSDAYEWVDLPHEGRLHGFTVQEAGMPAGFPRPLVFAMVEVGGFRIFTRLLEVADPAGLATGMPVRFVRLRVADDPRGRSRYLPAFQPSDRAGG